MRFSKTSWRNPSSAAASAPARPSAQRGVVREERVADERADAAAAPAGRGQRREGLGRRGLQTGACGDAMHH